MIFNSDTSETLALAEEMKNWYNKPNKSTYQRKQYEYWKGQYEKYRSK